MIVVSAGMQKSGSGWYYNLTSDLLVAAGHRHARDVREEHDLHDVLRLANCGLVNMRASTLRRLDEVSRLGQTFAVKTHRPPSRALRRLMAEGRFRGTYIYRDPRDVIVSALDHGRRMRENGELSRTMWIGPYRSFAKLRTVRGALIWSKLRILRTWEAWTRCPEAHIVRYEELLADPVKQLQRLAEYLELDVDESTMHEIVGRYQPENLDEAHANWLHMNKGVAGRFRDALSAEEQALCRRSLGGYLQRMGYAE